MPLNISLKLSRRPYFANISRKSVQNQSPTSTQKFPDFCSLHFLSNCEICCYRLRHANRRSISKESLLSSSTALHRKPVMSTSIGIAHLSIYESQQQPSLHVFTNLRVYKSTSLRIYEFTSLRIYEFANLRIYEPSRLHVKMFTNLSLNLWIL